MTSRAIVHATLLILTFVPPVASADLEVVLTGFESHSGTVAVALWDDPEQFLRQAADSASAQVERDEIRVVFEDLDPGTYAVSAYHDEDGDGELDSGMFRIPKEPTGFSNGHRPKMGPPKWRKAAFELGDEPMTVSIELR